MTESFLFPPQTELIEQGLLETRYNTLLNMSTGSGKTYISELAIEKTVADGYKAIYLTPLRALADEKYISFKERFPAVNVGVFTGDTISKYGKMSCSYKQAQIYIMTPERLDACLRNWRGNWSWLPDINLIVVDEFHLLGDNSRGTRLEGVLTRIQRLNPFTKIMGLSATMPNVDGLSDWLNGVYYKSDWRNVPLKKTIIQFKSAKGKPSLMIAEVKKCIKKKGQSLVFVNSRSRTQELAERLTEQGFKAAFHHAGLKKETRTKVENDFRNKEIDVLVCTSTLEMGLNLPARQVVVYDSYQFNGSGFDPLPVWKFMQRAGRAGRYKLDAEGEVVLLLPKWVSDDKYVSEECEPVLSQLTNDKLMVEQLLIELSCGYCRTREELTDVFLPLTLYKKQHRAAAIDITLNQMILADMLAIKENESDEGEKIRILKPTRIGRLAVKFMFSPSSILLMKNIYTSIEKPYLFDLLLMVTLTEDCNPVLRANYEDVECLVDIISPIPSNILKMSLEQLRNKVKDCPTTQRLLAGIKMAAICYALTEDKDKAYLAKALDVYETDIEMLKENVVRILDGMTSLLKIIDNEDEDPEQEVIDLLTPSKVCARLSAMLFYELDSQTVNLASIPGVGGKTAKLLAGNGYSTVDEIANLECADLTKLERIGKKSAKRIIDGAKNIINKGLIVDYSEEKEITSISVKSIKSKICPYRLKRSMELSVFEFNDKLPDEEGSFIVEGGREGHFVKIRLSQYTCDCMDFEKHRHDCKHILTIKRHLGDEEVLKATKKIKEDKNGSIKEALSSLWFSATKTK